ncbi:hypothetical protein JCM10213_005207 [Rhodosporidiobolus nylandii]
MAPTPSPSALLSTIRTSCAALTSRSGIVVDPAAVDRFIESVPQDAWDRTTGAEAHGVRLPLRFDSAEEELNLLATLALLNILSGYRIALHRLTGRGAYSTILSLVLSSYLSGSSVSSDEPSLLTASGLRACTPGSLAALARIETHREAPHPTLGPAVTVGEKDDEALEILELLAGVCTQTGEVLRRERKETLGAWMSAKLKETDGDVAKTIHALATTFPAFADASLVDGQPAFLYKKALWLVTVVALRFQKAKDDGERVPFPVPELSKEPLPVFADNVLPSLLIHHSILSLSSSSIPSLASLSLSDPSTLTLPSDAATALRAAAATACAAIVARAQELGREGWTEQRLDAYLWGWGKTEEGKSVARVVERGTVYY